MGVGFSVLSEFRSRLVAGAMETALLEALLARLGELGLVAAGMRSGPIHPRAGPDPGPEPAGAGRGDRAGALEALAAAAPGCWPG